MAISGTESNDENKIAMVIWRDKHLRVEINVNSNVKDFALKLLELTEVKADTMKLIIPSTNKGSKLLVPFSAQHSKLSLEEAAIFVGKPIRMMGVLNDEIERISHTGSKADTRIIGFEEEEKRMRQRSSNASSSLLKLPQGTYKFCDFRTLHLPGIELSPPPSEALKRLHMLACDPGIVAIMNKHRWTVGLMTEMAPIGYVGISPKCLLGFNKNHGEEISLRLRTDDLKGFRKYESIKKTLLHELAHMVYSEHDADFFALDKQLNEEAESLDWTKSKSYTLNGKRSYFSEEEFHLDRTIVPTGQKVGGPTALTSAHTASVAAAHGRIMSLSANCKKEIELDTNEKKYVFGQQDIASTESQSVIGTIRIENKKHLEPDPDDADYLVENEMPTDLSMHLPYDSFLPKIMAKLDPDSTSAIGIMQYEEPTPEVCLSLSKGFEPLCGNSGYVESFAKMKQVFPGEAQDVHVPGPVCVLKENMETGPRELTATRSTEPDPDDCMKEYSNQKFERVEQPVVEPNRDYIMEESQSQEYHSVAEPDPDDVMETSKYQKLQNLEDPAVAMCRRLQKAIEILKSEVAPVAAVLVLQTLFKIIRNVIEYPDDMKFRRIRKSNPSFQKNVANYKAAMELLAIVGFCEDVVFDEVGRRETYLVLKRNDPGLLWLAKSSLETCMA